MSTASGPPRHHSIAGKSVGPYFADAREGNPCTTLEEVRTNKTVHTYIVQVCVRLSGYPVGGGTVTNS